MINSKIAFYYSQGSNCSERVKWVLDYKQVNYDLLNADLFYGIEEYLKINPFGRVPAMVIDNFLLNESMVMAEYLEEVYPLNSVLPKDPFSRALVRQVCGGC